MALTKSIVATIIELQDAVVSSSGGATGSFIQNTGGTTKVATAEEVDTITFNASGSRILTMTHTSSLMELTSSTNYYYSKQTDNNLFSANLMGSQEAIIDKSTGLTKAGQFSFYFEDAQSGGWTGFNGENPLIGTDDSGSYFMAIHGIDGNEMAYVSTYNGLSHAGLDVSAKSGNATGTVSIGVSGTQGESEIVLSYAGSGSVTEINNNSSTGISRITLGDGAVVFSGSAVEIINTTANTTIPIFDSTYTGLPTEMPSIVGGLHVLSSSVASGSGSVSWSLQPAISDINVGNNKIVNLADPVAGDDAATKAYVDAQSGASDRIKGGAGTTYEETEVGVGPDATGAPSILLSGKNRGDEFLRFLARDNSSGTGWIGWHDSKSGFGRGYVRWSSSHAELYGAHSAGDFGRVYVDGWNGGNIYFDIPGASTGGGYESSKGIRLGSHSSHTPNIRALPSNVNSILHGIKLGVDAHDALASMPAPPELEWWDPVWTPVSNANSASNVECQYTRVYRAAGGSLVTLEGTITVEIDDDDTSTILSTPLPVPATSTGTLFAPAMGADLSRGDRAVCGAVITDMGSGPVLAIDATALANATGVPATLTIGFRISYRAA